MNFMVDIETLSTKPSGVIASVGACAFSPKGINEKTFYMTLDLQEQIDKGRTIDAGTIAFWMRQGDEARSALLGTHSVTSELFLKEFKAWVESFCHIGDAIFWSNGAAFDIPFLEDYAKDFKGRVPWNYVNARCFRTYAAMTKCADLMTEEDNEGTHHNAVDDAIWQARAMVKYMNKKGKK
jgi:hypothetical protein